MLLKISFFGIILSIICLISSVNCKKNQVEKFADFIVQITFLDEIMSGRCEHNNKEFNTENIGKDLFSMLDTDIRKKFKQVKLQYDTGFAYISVNELISAISMLMNKLKQIEDKNKKINEINIQSKNTENTQNKVKRKLVFENKNLTSSNSKLNSNGKQINNKIETFKIFGKILLLEMKCLETKLNKNIKIINEENVNHDDNIENNELLKKEQEELLSKIYIAKHRIEHEIEFGNFANELNLLNILPTKKEVVKLLYLYSQLYIEAFNKFPKKSKYSEILNNWIATIKKKIMELIKNKNYINWENLISKNYEKMKSNSEENVEKYLLKILKENIGEYEKIEQFEGYPEIKEPKPSLDVKNSKFNKKENLKDKKDEEKKNKSKLIKSNLNVKKKPIWH